MSKTERGGLEKIILAGIGAMASTAEKSRELLDELVKKGELTIEQGKIINEELKHSSSSTGNTTQPAQDIAISCIIESMDGLSPDELEQIRTKLQSFEASQ